jgi:hypothetical protein
MAYEAAKKPLFRKLDNYLLHVSDLDEAISFYRDRLGDLHAGCVARRRDEPEPGKQLELAVDRHIPHAGRIDPLANGVFVLVAVRVVELTTLDVDRLPAKRWLPPQWSACRCVC